jgi:benzoate-CoA ligase
VLPYRNMTEPILDHTLSRLPHLADKIVLTCGSRSWTHAQLRDNCNRFGNLLLSAGLRPGERLGIAMPDSLAWAATFLGAMRVGIIPVALNALFKPAQVEEIMRHCGATALVTHPSLEASAATAPALRTVIHVDDDSLDGLLAPHSPELEVHPSSLEDVAYMVYTSGSTGHPKGVPHLHGDYRPMYETFPQDVLRLTEDDVLFCPSKLSFAWGLANNIFYPPTVGARGILITETVTPARVLEIIQREKPTLLLTVPTLINALLPLLDKNTRLDSPRMCFSAGEPLPGAVLDRWLEKTGLPLYNCYGTSEVATCCVAGLLDTLRPEVSGRLLRHYQARIVDDNGQDVPDGEQGILALRGETLSPYYWNDPEWSERSRMDGDWWISGDRFRREGDTYIFMGRNDDMLKIGGIWVAPVMVESALLEHPQVRECAVTGMTVAGLTQVRAHVVPDDGLEPGPDAVGQLRRHVLERLPKYMCPSAIVFCEELPKTVSGKIQRFMLRTEPAPAQGDTA